MLGVILGFLFGAPLLAGLTILLFGDIIIEQIDREEEAKRNGKAAELHA